MTFPSVHSPSLPLDAGCLDVEEERPRKIQKNSKTAKTVTAASTEPVVCHTGVLFPYPAIPHYAVKRRITNRIFNEDTRGRLVRHLKNYGDGEMSTDLSRPHWIPYNTYRDGQSLLWAEALSPSFCLRHPKLSEAYLESRNIRKAVEDAPSLRDYPPTSVLTAIIERVSVAGDTAPRPKPRTSSSQPRPQRRRAEGGLSASNRNIPGIVVPIASRPTAHHGDRHAKPSNMNDRDVCRALSGAFLERLPVLVVPTPIKAPQRGDSSTTPNPEHPNGFHSLLYAGSAYRY